MSHTQEKWETARMYKYAESLDKCFNYIGEGKIIQRTFEFNFIACPKKFPMKLPACRDEVAMATKGKYQRLIKSRPAIREK